MIVVLLFLRSWMGLFYPPPSHNQPHLEALSSSYRYDPTGWMCVTASAHDDARCECSPTAPLYISVHC